MLAAACSDAAATEVTRCNVEDAPLRRLPAVPLISMAPESSAETMAFTVTSNSEVWRSNCPMRLAMLSVASLMTLAPCSNPPCRPPGRIRR
jgi:hypothetical protein